VVKSSFNHYTTMAPSTAKLASNPCQHPGLNPRPLAWWEPVLTTTLQQWLLVVVQQKWHHFSQLTIGIKAILHNSGTGALGSLFKCLPKETGKITKWQSSLVKDKRIKSFSA
jgi:hypothetical protein